VKKSVKLNQFLLTCDGMCSLQQGYECTRRFLTELITSPSSDDGGQLEEQHTNRCTAADSEHIAQNDVQSTVNQALHDASLTKLGKLCTSCNGLSNSLRVPAFVDCEPADDDVVPWCAASQHTDVSCGLDSSYSEASVLETQV